MGHAANRCGADKITAIANIPEKVNKRMSIFQRLLHLFREVWKNDEAQDIAEYAVMLAVILVIVVGTIRLVGSQANNVFSETASAIGG